MDELAWIDPLQQRMQRPLPGRAVQRQFAPELGYGRHFDEPPADARMAAVSVVLARRQDSPWHVPLVVRPATMPTHAGQVGLPGGSCTPGEATDLAALRELEEELGSLPGSLRLLGPLSPLWLYVSNFRVNPWLFVAEHPVVWRPDPREVESVLEVPLAWLADPAAATVGMRRERGVTFRAPCFSWQGHAVWGATCMILGELAALLREVAYVEPSLST